MDNLLKKISDILYYVHLIVFFDNDRNIFLSIIYIYFIFLIFIAALFIIMCLRFMVGKYNILWPINILRYALPIICITFFGQLFLILLSIFKCIYDNKLYYAADVECQIGSWYYITCPICCIGIILQIILSYITISLYYQADFICENANVLKKNNPLTELIFMFNKILIIIIFMFDKGGTNEHWPILFVLTITTGYNAYLVIYCQNYGNEIIKKLNYFFSLFLFWSFFSLLISNIFLAINFSGAFYLFLAGILILFVYCIFYIKTNLDFLNSNFFEINSSYDFINYINTFMQLVKEKEISRDSSIILTSFITKVEEKCTNKKCILKKYQKSLAKGFDSNFLLLQHAQKLFKLALNKFPMDLCLKIHYIIFLSTKVNQKKNAQKELTSIKKRHMLLFNKFNLFQCKKFTEENASVLNNKNKSMDDNDLSDIFQEIEYKNKYKEFLKLLSKSSSLYYEFWSSLYTSHLQGTEDFTKLNDIGAELNVIIEEIEKIFEKLREIKNNDLSILKIYESYLINILNNEEKYEKYRKISINLITDNKYDFEDKDFSNFDIKNLTNNDEYQFIIISANDDNRGTIINMSLNTCVYFGYTKDEIIGKNMCILIPELFHKMHIKLFNETTEKIKTEFFEKLSNKITYVPEFMEFSGFGRNKLKYLVPLDLKICFAQTEESDLVYIIDILRKNLNFTNKECTETNDIDKNSLCCVLTDNNFIIQTFTSNCVEILELDSKMINSNYDITNFIVQFNDELLSLISASGKDISLHEASEIVSNENSIRDTIVPGDNSIEKSFEYKLKKKKKLLKLKYSHQRKITWKINNTGYNNSDKKTEAGKISTKLSGLNIGLKKGMADMSKKKFIMEVKEARVANNTVGYYFYFRKTNQGRNEASLLNNESIKMEIPSSNRGKINKTKSSVKFYDEEEEAPKSSRIFYDDEDRNVLSITDANKDGANTDIRSKNELDFLIQKHESAKMLNDFKDEINGIIDEKYVPKCNFNFFLDLNTNAFKPTSTFEQTNEIYGKLRGEALEKINIVYQLKKNMNKKASSNSELSSKEDSSHSEYYSSSYYVSSNNAESKNEDSKIKSNNKDKDKSKKENVVNDNDNNNNNTGNENTNNKKKEENIDNEYYKVSQSKIKFMIYDFNQEMIVSSKFDKKSQVEVIIDNYKSRNSINISEDAYYVGLSFEKYIKDPKNKVEKVSSKNTNYSHSLNKMSEKKGVQDAEKEFEKDITYALSKQDEQNSIRYFYILSFIFLILKLVIIGTTSYFIIIKHDGFKDNLDLIINSVNLKYYTNIGILTIRENTLLSFDNSIGNTTYKAPDNDRNNYTLNMYSLSKKAFSSCNELMEKIIGCGLEFSDLTMNKLYTDPYYITIKYGDNQLRNVTSNLFTSFIQVYSAFCNLLQSSDISVSDTNLYNFMHNSFNQISMALNIQLNLFIQEMANKWNNLIAIIVSYGATYIFIHILFYILIIKCFISIANKKTSYISVFYGINLSLIKSSIRKCEIFINKINQNNKTDKLKLTDEENSSIISSSNFNSSSFKQNNKEKIKTKMSKSREIGQDKSTKRFKIILIITFIVFIIIYLSILASLNLFVIKYLLSAQYLFHLQHYHIMAFELFNGFREYLFDENTIISGMKAFNYLEYKQMEFYKSNTMNINNITILGDQIPGLTNEIKKLNEKGFCIYYIAYFKSEKECENFLGGKNGVSNFGFHFTMNDFIDNIRYGKNYLKANLDSNSLIGSLSDRDNEDINKINEEIQRNNGKKTYRLEMFNSVLHNYINVKFVNIVMQYILQEKDISVNLIQKNAIGGHLIYIIFLVIYGSLFLLIFWFIWIPTIRRLNIEIYKTKNMLAIIPVHILASLPNIRELLNISNKR